MKNLAIIILSIVGCALVVKCSQAATLALVHTGCGSGDPASKCTAVRYDLPKSSDLVRVCGSQANCWSAGEPVVRVFGTLDRATIIDACNVPSSIAPGTPSPIPFNAATDPCPATGWSPQPVSFFSPISTSGKVTLSWDPVTTGTCGGADLLDAQACSSGTAQLNNPKYPTWALRGYRVYSGTDPANLGLIRTVDPQTLSVDLQGYADGTYYFAVQAFNADVKTPDGDRSAVVSIEVKRSNSGQSVKPAIVEGTRIKVTFE